MAAQPPDEPDAGGTEIDARWVRRRLALVGSGTRVGLPVGLVATVGALVVGVSRTAAVDTVFALGALVLGLATLGWSGSVMAGRSIETASEYLGDGRWTEADSRRAMSRLVGLGAGAMVGATAVSVLAVTL